MFRHALRFALGLGVGLLSTSATWAAAPADSFALKEKTMVAWVTLDTLDQPCAGVMTLYDSIGQCWDGIVWADPVPRRWVAASEKHFRTNVDTLQQAAPAETAKPGELVQIAIVYRPDTTIIYRNGKVYCQFKPRLGLKSFSARSWVRFGHYESAWGLPHVLKGSIDDARIYNVPLTAEQVAALKPNEQGDIKPYGWWKFNDPKCPDEMGHFGPLSLTGGATIHDGQIHFDGFDDWAYCTLLARADERPDYHIEPAKIAKTIENARNVRQWLVRDPYRPTYHFVNPEGAAMPFDPNGAIYWRGRYHLFYIYQEGATHVWGHASSRDMLHWRHHEPGLYPWFGSPEHGIFSGACFVSPKGVPTLIYHGYGVGNSIATSTDKNLDYWQKLPSNPIAVSLVTKPLPAFASWDPHGWCEGNTCYAIFGGIAGFKPTVFKAREIDHWEYVGPLLASDPGGGDVSCPDLFQLGTTGKRVLVCINHQTGARYYVGTWKNEQFHPELHERMSWVDNAFFAPESLLDDRGRRIMWAWILGDGVPPQASGWAGTMSLPRVLTLGDDNRLRFAPIEELNELRYHERTVKDLAIPADGDAPLEGISGNAIELKLNIQPGTGATQFGLSVLRSPDGVEQTRIYYDTVDQKLKVDTRQSSLSLGGKSIEGGPLQLKSGEPLKLRVFIDKSVVEVFTQDGRQAVMRRVFPTLTDSINVSAFSAGGPSKLTEATAWDMTPANPN